ncbi:MAG: molybdopterin-dependent oxidoreductase [Proteobacteria bacterium]|nr:molybdopterin-dependent oxidoreductase [Pseudomonadota bacterium]
MADDLRKSPRSAVALPRASRRGFLVAMASTVAMFGFPLGADAAIAPGEPGERPITPNGKMFEPTIWYWIDQAGRINVHVINAEIGQHIGTATARILADELDADWKDIHIEHVDVAPKWGNMVTGGSMSVWGAWPRYRQAGAAGRVALIEAAAKLWGVAPESCQTRNSMVTSGTHSISYGELVASGLSRSFTDAELKALPLKPVSDLRLVGRNVVELDVPDKTDGKALFGIDAKVEGMVYGVPLLPPTRLGSSVVSIDDSVAKGMKGYIRTVDLKDPTGIVPGVVVVIGQSLMAAKWASEKVKVTWTAGPTAALTEQQMLDRARALIRDAGVGTILDTGDTETAPIFAKAAETLEAEYTCASVLHFQLEPVNATALRNTSGTWEVHTGTQWPSLILPALEQAVGAKSGEVEIKSYLCGGGFGRRLNGDYAVVGLLASKAMDGKPVKVVFFREEDALFDSFRSPSVQRLRMAFDKGKQVLAMDHDAAAGWTMEAMGLGAGMTKGKDGRTFDPNSIDGADHYYSVGPHKVRAISLDLANQLRIGFLRSVGPGWTNFALESFMDEAAHKVGVDPVQFRLAHLKPEGRNAGSLPSSVGGAARQAHVLKRVVELSGYGKQEAPGKDSAIGIATTYGQNRLSPTWIACAAKVHVERKSGTITVQKLWIVVDCGVVIDPDGSLAQIQGGALWGVSLAVLEGTTIENGRPRDRNLGTYKPLRMIDTPELAIEFVKSTAAPVGLGEPGVTVVAPAIANAVFNAVGVRVRHLPMTPDVVKKALTS